MVKKKERRRREKEGGLGKRPKKGGRRPGSYQTPPMSHTSNTLHRKTSADKAQEEAAAKAAAKTLKCVPTQPALMPTDPFPQEN